MVFRGSELRDSISNLIGEAYFNLSAFFGKAEQLGPPYPYCGEGHYERGWQSSVATAV
jgi:hypothetical protein